MGGGRGGRGRGREEKGRDGDRPGGRAGGRPPLCLRTMGRGKGALGGAGRGGEPRSQVPAWILGPGTPLFPPRSPALRGPSPGPLTRLRPVTLDSPGVQTPTPASQAGAAARDSRPLRGTSGGSGSCSEPGPPFPSPAAPSPHAFAFPGQPLLPWGRLRGRGEGGHRTGLGRQRFRKLAPLPEPSPTLPFQPVPHPGLQQGNWEIWRKRDRVLREGGGGLGARGVAAAQRSPKARPMPRLQCNSPFPEPALQL